MKARITKSFLKNLEPKDKPYEVVDTQLNGFLIRIQPSGSMTYYFAYRNKEGVKKRYRIGAVNSVTPQQARDAAEMCSSQVIRGIDPQVRKKEIKQEAELRKLKTLQNFLDMQYEPWILTHRKRGRDTMQVIRNRFASFLTTSIEDINVLKIEQWRRERVKEGKASTTINRQVAALRAVLSKAVEWDFLEHHPLEKLKPLKVNRTPLVRYLNSDEEERLFAALEERDGELKEARSRGNQWRKQRGYELKPDLYEFYYADRMSPMIIVSLKTGLRQGETIGLRWADVHMNHASPYLTVRAEQAKSSRVRHVPLSPTALATFINWRGQCSKKAILVFPSHSGEKLNNVKKAWKSILKKAEIENFRWHDMRHDFASKLVMKGVPLNTVRELCGHADLNTTLRYAHLAPDHKAEAIALLG
ncbi:site-specific integrase [Aliikangiella sp. G2MR2-5]|uniref:site-specific integrase n=1 Tax=Aliikangiella sp. G2MR2-5 TaxID=2788943 RepID=UPI0018ABA361|nr:site-specific integrase [Aliikangiella sp. G2MR2-5]